MIYIIILTIIGAVDFCPIQCTESAINQLKHSLDQYKLDTGLSAYIQLSIVQRGCSGFAYEMQFITQPDTKDFIIQKLNLAIKADSMMWLMGTTMDYVLSDTSTSFVFQNPHEKKSCHCGEAFYV